MSELANETTTSEARRIKLSILERMYNSTNSRLFQKLNGDHPAAQGGTMQNWLFQFVDIIYVGTVGNISRFIDRCGSDHVNGSLFMASFSILVIMFYTRAAFDSYVCISNAGGLIHVAVFCLYAAAVFVMSLNIAEDRTREKLEENPDMFFGACIADPAYMRAFACAFAASRMVLMIMYFLYLNVFHESNVTGTYDGDLPPVSRETLAIAKRASAKRSSTGTQPDDHLSEESADKCMKSARHSVVARHFMRIYHYKVFPLAVSIIVILALVYGVENPQPGIVFPTVAGIEILADFIPSLCIRDVGVGVGADEWKHFVSHRHFAQDRLGLFFMLVMGEGMLGFHAVFFDAFNQNQPTYAVVM